MRGHYRFGGLFSKYSWRSAYIATRDLVTFGIYKDVTCSNTQQKKNVFLCFMVAGNAFYDHHSVETLEVLFGFSLSCHSSPLFSLLSRYARGQKGCMGVQLLPQRSDSPKLGS